MKPGKKKHRIANHTVFKRVNGIKSWVNIGVVTWIRDIFFLVSLAGTLEPTRSPSKDSYLVPESFNSSFPVKSDQTDIRGLTSVWEWNWNARIKAPVKKKGRENGKVRNKGKIVSAPVRWKSQSKYTYQSKIFSTMKDSWLLCQLVLTLNLSCKMIKSGLEETNPQRT